MCKLNICFLNIYILVLIYIHNKYKSTKIRARLEQKGFPGTNNFWELLVKLRQKMNKIKLVFLFLVIKTKQLIFPML